MLHLPGSKDFSRFVDDFFKPHIVELIIKKLWTIAENYIASVKPNFKILNHLNLNQEGNSKSFVF